MTCTRETHSVQLPLDACTKDQDSHHASLLSHIVLEFTAKFDGSSRMCTQPRIETFSRSAGIPARTGAKAAAGCDTQKCQCCE